MPASLCRAGHPILGGTTRILIIDDDPKTSPPLLQAADSGPAESSGATWPPETQRPADHARPVMHEYQIATPLPGELVPAHEASGELNENGHPDTTTVRELIARVEELLHRTR